MTAALGLASSAPGTGAPAVPAGSTSATGTRATSATSTRAVPVGPTPRQRPVGPTPAAAPAVPTPATGTHPAPTTEPAVSRTPHPAGGHASTAAAADTPAPTPSTSPAPAPPFRTVAIVGLGLIGGSLARALAALDRPPRVVAASQTPSSLEMAGRAGVIEAGSTDPEAVLARADLVVYATPLDVTLRLLADHRARWPAEAMVTDVVSLKGPVEEAMVALGESARHTGSHPMAGGEGSGFGHSAADLFAGATVWLTGTGAGAAAVEALWRAVGARPRWTTAPEHDRLMSWCSHLPQLASNALARVLEESGHAPSDLGTGGADMVRLAGSSPEMWLPLLSRSEAGDALRELARAAEELADALGRRDLEAIEDLMTSTRAWRAGDAGTRTKARFPFARAPGAESRSRRHRAGGTARTDGEVSETSR